MRIAPSTECEGCKKQIGNDDYLIAHDGITSKLVAFHLRCNPAEPDLQRHYKVGLEPITFTTNIKGIS